MRTLLKAAVFLVPLAAVLFALRACREGDAERLLERVARFDRAARIVVDEADLIVIAPDGPAGVAAYAMVRDFRADLLAHYADLLGEPTELRMIVVVFSTDERLRAYASERFGASVGTELYGYCDPAEGAVYVPRVSVETLRHETVHWIVGTARRNAMQHSPWLSEGIAQLFESYEPHESDRPSISDEQILGEVARIPAAGLDVDRLVEIDDYRVFTGVSGLRNYAEALVLTAFLFERDRSALGTFIRTDRGGPGSAGRFRAHFRADDPAFRRDLDSFLAALRGG
jgi:hypothetical protein